MKKKTIGIIIVIILIIVAFFTFFFFVKPQPKEKIEKKKDIQEKKDPNFYETIESNILDWSERENEVRTQTGNSYYTINNSLQFMRDRDFNSIHLKSIWLVRVGEKLYSFSAELSNDTGKDTEEQKVSIVFLKEDGSTMAEVETTFPAVKNGETAMLSATTSKDVLYAYDFKIKKLLDKKVKS